MAYTTKEVHARVHKFMRLRGTAPSIHRFLRRHGLSPGVDWGGSSKTSMADAYAEGYRYGKADGPVIGEEVFNRLVEEFGLRPEKEK